MERREIKIQPMRRGEGGRRLGQSFGSEEKAEKGDSKELVIPLMHPLPRTLCTSLFPFRFRDSPQALSPNKYLLTPPPHKYCPPPPSWSATSQSPWQRPHSSQEMGRELGPWQGEGVRGARPGPQGNWCGEG